MSNDQTQPPTNTDRYELKNIELSDEDEDIHQLKPVIHENQPTSNQKAPKVNALPLSKTNKHAPTGNKSPNNSIASPHHLESTSPTSRRRLYLSSARSEQRKGNNQATTDQSATKEPGVSLNQKQNNFLTKFHNRPFSLGSERSSIILDKNFQIISSTPRTPNPLKSHRPNSGTSNADVIIQTAHTTEDTRKELEIKNTAPMPSSARPNSPNANDILNLSKIREAIAMIQSKSLDLQGPGFSNMLLRKKSAATARKQSNGRNKDCTSPAKRFSVIDQKTFLSRVNGFGPSERLVGNKIAIKTPRLNGKKLLLHVDTEESLENEYLFRQDSSRPITAGVSPSIYRGALANLSELYKPLEPRSVTEPGFRPGNKKKGVDTEPDSRLLDTRSIFNRIANLSPISTFNFEKVVALPVFDEKRINENMKVINKNSYGKPQETAQPKKEENPPEKTYLVKNVKEKPKSMLLETVPASKQQRPTSKSSLSRAMSLRGLKQSPKAKEDGGKLAPWEHNDHITGSYSSSDLKRNDNGGVFQFQAVGKEYKKTITSPPKYVSTEDLLRSSYSPRETLNK